MAIGVDLAAGLIEKLVDLLEVGVEDLVPLHEGEALERGQQEGLTGARRDLLQPLDGAALPALGRGRALQIDLERPPQFAEQMVQGHPKRDIGSEPIGIGNQGLEQRHDIGIAALLAAGEST